MKHDLAALRKYGGSLRNYVSSLVQTVRPDPGILSESQMRDYFRRADQEAKRLADLSSGQALEGWKHFVDERVKFGWRRTDPTTRYRPDEPKLFYAYQTPAKDSDVKPVVEAIRRSFSWRTARGSADNSKTWTQTHATSVARKDMLGMEHTARGFRARRDLETGAVTIDVFAYINRVSPHASDHHLVVGLEFDQPDQPRMRWKTPQSEECVATVVSTVALAQGLSNMREFSLEKGGWRYVRFDIPYRADYLRPRAAPDVLEKAP